jgi:hypothetical protein
MSFNSYSQYLGSQKCCDIRGTGPQGLQGPRGPQGAIGPIGLQGATGAPGTASARGDTGFTGATGPQGATGAPGTGGVLGYWGSFWSDVSQNNVPDSTTRPMILNNTDLNSSGISITNDASGNPTQIKFDNSGVYNIQFSAQLYDSTSPGSKLVEIWFRLNGIDISDSNTNVNTDNQNSYYVASWNYMLKLNANDYVQIMWYSTDSGFSLLAKPPNSGPSIPSVIVTAQQVMYTQLGPTGAQGATGTISPSGTTWGQALNWNDSTNSWQITGNTGLAFGNNAGKVNQGNNSIGIGSSAGYYSQGQNSIAIGAYAGATGQPSNSIIINASGTILNGATGSSCYINPIRLSSSTVPFVVYNTTTNEVTYNTSSIKYKKNVIDLSVDTSDIYKVRPREYDTISENLHYIGFIAEELNQINPLFTWKNPDGTPEGIEWFNMLVFMINELKKLKEQNNLLNDKINILENIIYNNN